MLKTGFTNRCRAFGLMDFFAVGIVVFLLLAILLPSLMKAREQAKKVKCKQALNSIAKASVFYASEDEENNVIPFAKAAYGKPRGEYLWGGKAGWGGADPKNPETLRQGQYTSFHDAGPGQRPLNPYLYKDLVFPEDESDTTLEQCKKNVKEDLTLFQCPSDTGDTNHGWEAFPNADRNNLRSTRAFRESRMSAYDYYGTSYVASLFWVEPKNMYYSRVGATPEGKYYSLSAYAMPINRIRSTESVLTFREANSRFAWRYLPENADIGECSGLNEEPRHNPDAVTRGWHQKDWTFNSAFVDGHVDEIKMRGAQVPPVELEAAYPGWNPSYKHRCEVTVRGSNWHLDTLPTPPIKPPHHRNN